MDIYNVTTTTLLDFSTSAVPNITKNVLFSWHDYIFFVLMLLASIVIGIYFGCFGSKQSTTNEYLLGNKEMKILPIAISLVASHISGITLLAVPADVYKYGAMYWWGVVSILIVSVITIYVFLPIFYELKITSTYEYLERRFDTKTRQFASFLFGLSLFLYLPIVIYIPALAFSAENTKETVYCLLESTAIDILREISKARSTKKLFGEISSGSVTYTEPKRSRSARHETNESEVFIQ